MTTPHIHGVRLDQIPVRGKDTGIPLSRLLGFVMRNGVNDPIGWYVDGELLVLNDWRLRALQVRLGVEPLPDPESLIVVVVLH